MNDKETGTSISLSTGDELLDAVTEAGRTKALPITFEDESGVHTINVPADGGETDRDQRDHPASARAERQLRLVR